MTSGGLVIGQAANDRAFKFFPRPSIWTPYDGKDFPDDVLAVSDEGQAAPLRTAKVIVIGDVAVGKTCLIHRFCHNAFELNYKPTIGVDFEVEHFNILGLPFNLQIWDTAGQERFRCIAAAYYRGAKAIVIVFDMSDPHSLENSAMWMSEALQQQNNTSHNTSHNTSRSTSFPLRFLVGTKCDLMSRDSHQYATMEEAARDKAAQLNAELWILSSKSGVNVKEFFFRLSALSLCHVVAAESAPSDTVALGASLIQKSDEQTKSRCCKF